MKDKKNIVFLIVSIIIFCISLVFAIWSFKVDLTLSESETLDLNQNSSEFINTTLAEQSETKDLEATYSDFTTYSLDGSEINLSDYNNSPVMVLFWNSENEKSVEMLKRVNEFYDTYKDSINFLAIHTTENMSESLFTDISVPIYYDKNQTIVNQYNITELPAMLYINEQNEIFNSKTGLTTNDALEANLDILSNNF